MFLVYFHRNRTAPILGLADGEPDASSRFPLSGKAVHITAQICRGEYLSEMICFHSWVDGFEELLFHARLNGALLNTTRSLIYQSRKAVPDHDCICIPCTPSICISWMRFMFYFPESPRRNGYDEESQTFGAHRSLANRRR
jgi:hypothetical protein